MALMSPGLSLAGNTLAQPLSFSFAVIANAFQAGSEDALLSGRLAKTDQDNLAFVIVNGIKSSDESCSDELYLRRKGLLDTAQNGVIVSLSQNDWIDCRNSSGRPVAIERLNRLRELFFDGEFSLGGTKIPLQRESSNAKFRSYAENARWELGGVLFATIHLPAANNHYRTEAGRNSEFEDRQIANRDWLQSILAIAKREKMAGIVLFCDGNPLSISADGFNRRDGFLEIRRYLSEMAGKFSGKILLIHGQPLPDAAPDNTIVWQKNLGSLNAQASGQKFTVNHATGQLFGVAPTLPR
ncbi:MAG: hypothetical protein V4805_07495 [Pseudomonadota bacterium]